MELTVDFNIGCQEVVIKAEKAARKGSKIWKRLSRCLNENQHSHMLRYVDDKKEEFIVKLTDKKSPKWEQGDISLFADLDSISSKHRDKAKYSESCKGRFKANMKKLCDSKYLRYLGEKKNCEVVWKKYKILQDPSENKFKEPKKNKLWGKKNVNADVQAKLALPSISFETGPNTDSLNQFHIAGTETPTILQKKTQVDENLNSYLNREVTFQNTQVDENLNSYLNREVTFQNSAVDENLNSYLNGEVTIMNTQVDENSNSFINGEVTLKNSEVDENLSSYLNGEATFMNAQVDENSNSYINGEVTLKNSVVDENLSSYLNGEVTIKNTQVDENLSSYLNGEITFKNKLIDNRNIEIRSLYTNTGFATEQNEVNGDKTLSPEKDYKMIMMSNQDPMIPVVNHTAIAELEEFVFGDSMSHNGGDTEWMDICRKF